MGEAKLKPVCKTCVDNGFDGENENCLYCGVALSTRHEHDHFPVPRRNGGDKVWPVCYNCHDFKDRLAFNRWSPDVLLRGFWSLPPEGKMVMARLLAEWSDRAQGADDG